MTHARAALVKSIRTATGKINNKYYYKIGLPIGQKRSFVKKTVKALF